MTTPHTPAAHDLLTDLYSGLSPYTNMNDPLYQQLISPHTDVREIPKIKAALLKKYKVKS